MKLQVGTKLNLKLNLSGILKDDSNELTQSQPMTINNSLIFSTTSRTPKDNKTRLTFDEPGNENYGSTSNREKMQKLSYRNQFLSTLTSVKPSLDLERIQKDSKIKSYRKNEVEQLYFQQEFDKQGARNGLIQSEFDSIIKQGQMPEGMYILPQKQMILETPITEWHGTFFVRSGPFVGAVLKFTIEFSSSYPTKVISDQSFPEIIFQQFENYKMWHPFIDELMGFLDLTSLKKKYLKQQGADKENPKQCFLMMAEILQFIWSIFIDLENQTQNVAQRKNQRMAFNFDEFVNPVAARQLIKDPIKYTARAQMTAAQSKKEMFVENSSDDIDSTNLMFFAPPSQCETDDINDPTENEVSHLIESIGIKLKEHQDIFEDDQSVHNCIQDFIIDLDQQRQFEDEY